MRAKLAFPKHPSAYQVKAHDEYEAYLELVFGLGSRPLSERDYQRVTHPKLPKTRVSK